MEYTEKLTQLDSRLTAAGITFYREEPMSRHTTLRIGGPAERLVCPDSERQLLTAAKLCRELELPVLLIGRGSNLLVSDQGLRGVVLCPGQRPVRSPAPARDASGSRRDSPWHGRRILPRSRAMPGWNSPMAFPAQWAGQSI